MSILIYPNIVMIKKYKSAAYYFDSNKGLTPEVIASLDEWLNTWKNSGYVIDSFSEINKDGTTKGYLYIFKIEQ